MNDSQDEYKLKSALRDVRDVEGRGTELVTLYIPPSDNIDDWVSRLSAEYSEADNIKSKRTRTRVQTALKKSKKLVQKYSSVPSNGLVVFVGETDEEEFKYVFDTLPSPIDQSNYICDDHFHTGPVEAVVAPDDAYGLIVLTRDKAAIGLKVGNGVQMVREVDSHVMGKTRAGGQSAQRFARVRERQKHNHFQRVAAAAEDAFLDNEGEGLSVEGVLIGGTSHTVDDFQSNEYPDYRIRDALLATYDIAYGNETALNQLVDKAERVLQEHQNEEARKFVDRFFNQLGDNTDKIAYSVSEVERAIEYGAVDTLLLSEKLDEELVEQLTENAENIGSDVVFIPPSFDRGERFYDVFDGVGAILRYEI